ncbi:MAG TPA: hypothetical protein VFT46_12790 [Holophagaceae bacterium]|nr:hypothetical protein [Holophagaceae bacterium]
MTVDQCIAVLRILVWPIVVIWLAYMFRAELQALMDRMSQFRYRDFEAKFNAKMAEAEQGQKSAPMPQAEPKPDQSRNERIQSLIAISPRSAVLEAWIEFEQTARTLSERLGMQMALHNPMALIHRVASEANLPDQLVRAMGNLRELRNMAAHAPDFAISPEMAQNYANLAFRAIDLLNDTARKA